MDIQKTKSKTRITKNTMPTTNSSTIQVQKRDGRLESLDINKIHFVVEEACEDLTGVSASQIEMNANIQFYDGMSTKDIQNVLVRSANDLILEKKHTDNTNTLHY
jgi:transcriptional regulator NrdR family protein